MMTMDTLTSLTPTNFFFLGTVLTSKSSVQLINDPLMMMMMMMMMGTLTSLNPTNFFFFFFLGIVLTSKSSDQLINEFFLFFYTR